MTRKRATQDQIGRIVSMLVSRQIDFDEAQAIIRKYGKREAEAQAGTATPKTESRADPEPQEPELPSAPKWDLDFWEKRFFGKGAVLMEFVGPFQDWRPRLASPLPDLEQRAREAVFFREFKEVRCVPFSHRDEYEGHLRHTFQDLLGNVFDSETYRDALQRAAWDLVADLFIYRTSLNRKYRDNLGGPMLHSLKWILVHACHFAIVGELEKAGEFKPLIDLWLAGNFPIGIGYDGNLLVLVAD